MWACERGGNTESAGFGASPHSQPATTRALPTVDLDWAIQFLLRTILPLKKNALKILSSTVNLSRSKMWIKMLIQFSSVQSLSRVRLFETPWTGACQTSLSITNSWSLLKLTSIELVMPPTISSSVTPFSSRLQSFQILQARVQQYVNHKLPDIQAGFRKGRGTRDQIANIKLSKARGFQKNIYFCFIDCTKTLTVWITTNCGKFLKRWKY